MKLANKLTVLRIILVPIFLIFISARHIPYSSTIATASAAFAPAVNPSKPGSASGFRVMPCIIAPAMDRAAPTKIAATSRGKRISRIMEMSLPSALEASDSHTSFT